MKLNAIIVIGTLIPTCLVASAQELQTLKFGRRVQPRAFAWTDANGRMITSWKQLDGGSLFGCASDLLLYDNFEADETGTPTDDCYDHDCGFPDPTGRWFFGTRWEENQRQFVIDDMVVAPGAEGVPTSRIQLAYYLGPCGDVGFSRVFIGLTIYDDVSNDCLGLDCDGDGEPDCAAANPLDLGLVWDMGVLRCNDWEGGYRILDIDLCAIGEPPLPMPPDGAGGYSVTLARDYDPDTGEFTLAHSAQMMLWGNTLLKTGNPSDQEITYWVDGNADQQIDILNECASAFFPPDQCPQALGTMVAFYGTQGEPGFERCSGEFVPGDCDEPCDMNCDGEINAFDIEPFLGLLFGGDEPCCGVRGVPPFTGDVDGDGDIDAFDIEPFLACLFP